MPLQQTRLTPMMRAVAALLTAGAAMGGAGPAHAQRALGAAWMAQKNTTQNTAAATGRLPNGQPVPMLGSPQAQQQQAHAQLQRSIDNLNLAARVIAAQQAAQAAARAAALAAGSEVPDGLAEGGLKVDTNSLTAGWLNANAPTQGTADGKTNVAIQQTADKAILNWETFNVGRNTTVEFRQQADWAVLNRVNDPQARPSQIQGRIKADGTVLVVNRNGIVFGGSSQVDTRNLVAAAARITDSQFQTHGLYSAGTTPSFTTLQEDLGRVEVQAGARIATPAPTASTDGGGYVMLLGKAVHNAGDIATPKGQALLAAGDGFVIRKGAGTAGNPASTTRGNEVVPQFAADSRAGQVTNTGLVVAREGDVTLAGREVRQEGVLLATTTVNTRGTVHLQALGAEGRVTLAQGATTAVVIDDDGKTTALDSQRAGLRTPVVVEGQDLVNIGDRRDQSLVEIASGGSIDFQGDSLTLATGGQIVADAAGRSLVRDGAQIDVAGAVGVRLAMDANNILVNVQGNEQRDAPGNRDGKALNSKDLWIDRRSLVFVARGTNGYASERWYTAGGLLEVGGYLGTQGHTVGEWMAQGGTLRFGGSEVVTQAGSLINLSGGTLDVQTGKLRQSWLKGSDGRLYEVGSAPGDLRYEGVYQGFEDRHARWGEQATGHYQSPLIAPQYRLESGYTVGRDAGKLVVATQSAVLEGTLVGEAYQGPRQTQAARSDLDGYDQSQLAAARRGQLIVGQYTPSIERSTGTLHHALAATIRQVELRATPERIAADLDLGTALPAQRQGTLVLDTAQLEGFALGALRIAASEGIGLQSALQLADGGLLTFYGNEVAVNAGLTAHGGRIELGNVLAQKTNSGLLDSLVNGAAARGHVTLAEGVKLDVSGLWRNLALDAADALGGSGLAHLDGGSVSIRASGDLLLQPGSVIDVSSGAALSAGFRTQAGRGGDVTLATTTRTGTLQLAPDVALHGQGLAGGGKLVVQAHKVRIADTDATAPEDGTLQLAGGFFGQGFSAYEVTGRERLEVAEGTQVAVRMPVYRLADGARTLSSEAGPKAALALWTPPLYQEDASAASLTQRQGASLRLQAGGDLVTELDPSVNALVVGRDARLEVDPGQTIALRGAGQITVDGTLRARGGAIDVRQQQFGFLDVAALTPAAQGTLHARSIWIGDHAVLDVSALAHSAVDVNGRTYGRVDRGGSIVLGGVIDHAKAVANAADAYVIVRPGARLDASGAQAVLDLPGLGPTTVASDGGRIALSSYLGLHLEGALRAAAGGAGAAGGALEIALESPLYVDFGTERAQDAVIVPRELTLSALPAPALAPALAPGQADAALHYGKTRLSTERLGAGGFDSLALLVNGQLSFDGDVALSMGQGLKLFSSSMSLAESSSASAQVRLAAPYVTLSGTGAYYANVGRLRPRVLFGVTEQMAQASFSVEAGRLLDLGNSISFGTLGSYAERAEFTPVHVERRGFASVSLASQGDLRLLAATDNEPRSRLWTSGDLTLAAAQLYPETGATVQVNAGYRTHPVARSQMFDPDSVLRFERRGETLPAMPYSAFGSIDFGAGVIAQGGVVRAPFGVIRMGSELPLGTTRLSLLPGSITSVSGAGLAMPYGGTTDGIDYRYDGNAVRLQGAGGGAAGGFVLSAGIALAGRQVDVQDGALIDLAGGGELAGAGFVSGRGGSTDARFHPLVQNAADGSFSLPALSTHAVYAIVPGAQPAAAPAGGEAGASAIGPGRQITIGAGIPGLPAGTYTLMPSTYALLPGAFRVELNGLAEAGAAATHVQAMRNGSWAGTGRLSVAGTGIRDSLASRLIVTPAEVLRTYAQYNETSYADFVRSDAARLGVPRAMLPADARTLALMLTPGHDDVALRFDGQARLQAAEGGHGGTAAVLGGNIEVLGAGHARSAGFAGVSVRSDTLNALDADRLVVGGMPTVIYGQDGRGIDFNSRASGVVLREGASLQAPEVFLAGRDLAVEAGARISTLGQGAAIYDSAAGFVYRPGEGSLLAVSNGRLDVMAPAATGAGSIRLGVCGSAACHVDSALYTEGTLTAATNGAFALGDSTRYGARYLSLAVGGVNAGSAEALADAAARGVLASGLTLNQGLLQRLLSGDASTGAPALEALTLTARDAINFYGSVTLDTIDPATGRSHLDTLVLGTPAIYGHGTADDVATIRTRNLVWSGATQAPGAVVAGGAGTGSGTLAIEAARIAFGGLPNVLANGSDVDARLALGFGTVRLAASERITASQKGSLAVHQHQGAYDTGKGHSYSGGHLELRTPMLTGDAGAVLRVEVGGTLRIDAPAGTVRDPAIAQGVQALGADLGFDAHDIQLGTAIVLPSGRLALRAQQDITLADGALVDLGGRRLGFHDVDKYSWGGDAVLESRAGDIRQASGATIDLSAANNRAGTLQAVALDAAAGTVDLQGRILGGSSGRYDAGGTLVPFKAGSVDIRAQQLGGALDGAFAALNQRLNEGGVFGARSFQLKQGDLTIGHELKAGEVSVSVDNGRLTVAGTIDASGERVGTIRLAGRQGLTIGGGAVLDAHGTLLRVDSHGQIIDAPNRAMVVLDGGEGLLTLAGGARIDLRHGTAATLGSGAGQHDGQKRGTLELNAARTGETSGDIRIDASGALAIEGARSIALNAVWRYDDSDPLAIVKDGSDAVSGRPYREVTQAYLDRKHEQSTKFIDAALANEALVHGKLAGLNNAAYADALHLRPGVEIVTDKDLVVQGDLDLSGFRYASLNARTQKRDGVHGSGEAGSLVLRAAGDMEVYGSINDGFAPPPPTPDDGAGWALVPGLQPYNGDLLLPIGGVRLADGTAFPSGATLNYDLPMQELILGEAVRLPAAATLAQPHTFAAGTVLAAEVRDASGQLLHARGTLLKEAVTLPAGTRLGAGTPLPRGATLRPMVWPQGVPLPVAYVDGGVRNTVLLGGALDLRRGALIPSNTQVKLEEGVGYIDLRPVVDGRQGRNWALAPLLPAGSESWSLRLVAGADLGAADSRLTMAHAGNLRLADNHYGAKVVQGGGTLVWSLGNNFGFPAGTPVAADEAWLCELISPTDCVSLTGIAWGPDNSYGQPATTPVGADDLWWCEIINPADCVDYGSASNVMAVHGQGFSVLRTGTGDLDLVASGDLHVRSLYGIYTAGTQSAGVDARHDQARGTAAGQTTVLGPLGGEYEALVAGTGRSYHAWFPEAGGNLTVRAGGDVTGDMLAMTHLDPSQRSSVNVGNWLWRQGDGSAALPTAWWINFGSYAVDPGTSMPVNVQPSLVGFVGFGTLGGGNLQLHAGGDAGMLERKSSSRSQGLVTAVGSTGRVADDGSLVLTGGGDLEVRIDGGLNSALEARGRADGSVTPNHDLQGALINLRGATQLRAASVGGLVLGGRDLSEPRAFDPFSANRAKSTGGVVLIPGDSAIRVDTLGDLVIGGASDPGRVRTQNSTPFAHYGGGGLSWFSLWTEHTAIDLFSAGGNLTPSTLMSEGTSTSTTIGTNTSPTDYRFVYPSILRAVAPGGSIYSGSAANGASAGVNEYTGKTSLLLAPGRGGQLELIAGASLFMGGYAINPSGADPALMPDPLRPAFAGFNANSRVLTNLGGDGNDMRWRDVDFPLFAFTPDSYAAARTDAPRTPSRFYAMDGDILGLRSGEILLREDGRTWYEAAAPTWVMAGRDIVGAGTVPGQPTSVSMGSAGAVKSSGNLAIHNHAQDVSRVVAGRDILYSSFNVAGPGTLEISAGRNIQMEDRAAVTSLGALLPGDARPGARIAMLAGVGAQGPDHGGFLARYLDAANRARAGTALADQPGKVVKTYEAELHEWLADPANGLGFGGTAEEARAFFDALPAAQQRVFARQVYFAELQAGGREYNDADGVRFGSYLRGRNAIATLFPAAQADGQAIDYRGHITMYGPAGVNTLFGGDIQMLTPGGQQVFGVEGAAPRPVAGVIPGVITQGAGDIAIYSLGSILLGQSRIMTTFGGGILGWSAEGDINAGRGSKTTVVYTPPKRVYDQWGNVKLSSDVPSTGAGIATLAPIAEVPAGDIDLIAPLGTIDAGEAGIRVSGNVNLAALQVVNAANIAVKGEAIGIPTVAAVNVGALTNASAAASQAAGAAQEVLQRERVAARQALPSVFTVRVLGFGSEAPAGLPPGPDGGTRERVGYDPDGVVQVLGAGALTAAQQQPLTPGERRGLVR